MALYWPGFEFTYTLDVTQLLPHIAAIEAATAASSTSVLPPPWREQPAAGECDAPLSDPSAQAARVEQIQKRKQELLRNNASRALAWVRQRFAPGSAPMSLDDILTMHRMIAEESGIRYANVGVLRKDGQRGVVGEAGLRLHLGRAAAQPPPPVDSTTKPAKGTPPNRTAPPHPPLARPTFSSSNLPPLHA